MKGKLESAVSKFFVARAIKLEQEEKMGRVGWDDLGYKDIFKGRLERLSRRKLNQKNLINIANYCNFLWNLLETEGEKNE